jgi:hypothetical protein
VNGFSHDWDIPLETNIQGNTVLKIQGAKKYFKKWKLPIG